jgi:hypothetical protein
VIGSRALGLKIPSTLRARAYEPARLARRLDPGIAAADDRTACCNSSCWAAVASVMPFTAKTALENHASKTVERWGRMPRQWGPKL